MKTPLSWLGLNSKQQHLYRKGLLIILLVTSLPILITGVAVNWFGTLQIEKEVIGAHQKQVRQASERIDEYLSHLENTATQWVFNPIFGSDIRKLEQYYDYEMILDIYKTLFLIKGSNLLIDQVALYLDGPGKLISEERGVVVLSDNNELSRFHSLLEHSDATYWLPSFGKVGSQETVKSPALIYKLPPGSSDPYAVLIINLKINALTKMIEELVPYEKGGALLLDSSGQIIVPVHSSTGLQSKLTELLNNNVMNPEGSLSTDIFSLDREKYSVMSGNFRRLGSTWHYATASSMSNLLIPVVIVSRLIYAISLCSLLVAAALSLIASKKLYQPIQHLIGLFRMNRPESHKEEEHEDSNEIQFIERQWALMTKESASLRQRLGQQLPSLREGFLLQYLYGHLYYLSEDDLRERMLQLGWEVEEKGFAVLVVRMHGLSSINGRFHEGDEQLITFAMANITNEVSSRWFEQAEVVNFQDLSVGLLVIYPLEHDPETESVPAQIKTTLYQFAKELVHNLQALLKMKLTISLGRLTVSIREVPDALQEARHVQNFRNVDDTNQILDVTDYLPQGEEMIHYPFNSENELIQSLRAGKKEDAFRLLEQFCNELEKNADRAYMFQQGLLQLLGNIQYAFLKSGYPIAESKEGANFFVQLSQIRGKPDAVRWFAHKIVLPYIQEVQKTSDAQDVRLKLLVDNVMETLLNQYTDSSLSLESCADLYHVNPFTLSKVFKQITGVNFIDYLTGLRINKSKELLTQTNLKINEIAEQVGYQTTYFNRIFKKHEFVTPSQYRETYQDK
jgi:AraC-like DNA-binding protein